MSTVPTTRDWADVLAEHATREQTASRLIAQLRACEVAALAFCRLLERWARGEADPCTPGKRQAALRRAADRAETALAGLEQPLGRYLLELEPEMAEGRSWYGEPGAGELRECIDDGIVEIKLLQEHLHDGIGQLVYDRTRRRPMILPVVVEV